jgi:hypothetical protein
MPLVRAIKSLAANDFSGGPVRFALPAQPVGATPYKSLKTPAESHSATPRTATDSKALFSSLH